MCIRTTLIVLALSLGAALPGATPFPAIYDTEAAGSGPMSAEEAAKQFQLPPGFEVTLFAGEPDVRQPIAMSFDSRGRLWVAENYTYAERPLGFDRNLRDRILILEDTNGDGRFDQRTVFWDQARLLTSIEVGFGGVWALCPPHLLFIPDRDGDGVPDGEPEILLDGWNDNQARHNFVNGLKWGPDGWLYGRHGILATSEVGKPGASPDERREMNCGIWRYHPTRHEFEVVADGTTNPWGMDWNDRGEPFFINTVIGHFWHLIPGAHYRRMGGQDLTPHVYGLIEQHADHFHWNTQEEAWTNTRTVLTDRTAAAGGGHAHSGMMIYQGDNWPMDYRGRVFTLNFHGRRLNQERLERTGSGYVAIHEPDLIFSADPWFRGIEMLYGPDGGVYISDWSDTGECHDNSGIHRSSGRIYKVTYGRPQRVEPFDLAALGDVALARLQLHANEWFPRQSRRLLQERAAAGRDLSAAAAVLRDLYEQEDITVKLRALWTLHAISAAPDAWLQSLLGHSNEHIQAWAIRLLTDTLPLGNRSEGRTGATLAEPVMAALARLTAGEPSPLVRLTLASSLQRLPIHQRARLIGPLLARAEDADDHNLPLMLWYALEPIAEGDPMSAAQLARSSAIPLTRNYLARRLAQELERHPEPVEELLSFAAASDNEAVQRDVLSGISEGLRGRRKTTPPRNWEQLSGKFEMATDPEIQERVRDLSALFGDGRALEELHQVALNHAAPVSARQTALQALIDHNAPDLREICEGLLYHRDLGGIAARGLSTFDDPAIGEQLARTYSRFAPDQRPAVIAVLVSRPSFARALLNHVGQNEGSIPSNHLTASHVRQIRNFNDPGLNHRLGEVWGEVRDSDAELRQSINRYKTLLTPEKLAAGDLRRGRLIFNQSCAACHRLYGTGGDLGPDLTGSGRADLDYLLDKIIDPRSAVPAEWRLSVVTLSDGRVLNGVVGARTEQTVTVRTLSGHEVLNRNEIKAIEQSSLSLMPEGLLAVYDDEEVRDLIAYLMSMRQVPLPDAPDQ